MDVKKEFSLDQFKVSQDFQQQISVKRQLVKVPVRKPHKSWFVRVHPDSNYRATVYLVEIADSVGCELYLVSGDISSEVYAEFQQYMKVQTVYTAVSRQGDVFLWPVPQPGMDGKDLDWWESAREAASEAVNSWVRVVANQGLGVYDVYIAQGNLADPEWPSEDFGALLFKGFKGKIIDSIEHEALNKLRGLI